MEPSFLTLAEVLAIHRDQIQRYGGAHGLRDRHRLEAAAAMPMAAVQGEYLHADLSEMAAAYLYHLVQNHPFVDGNKRTGTVAALVFLALNGYKFMASQEELTELVLSVARGQLLKSDVAQFFRKHHTKR